MKSIRLALSCAVLGSLTFAAGCVTTPRPVVEANWQDGARSAAKAKPAPNVETAEVGGKTAHTAVDGAMQTVSAAKKVASDAGSHVKVHAPAIARAELKPEAKIGQPPGMKASSDKVARWLVTARAHHKSAEWIQKQLDKTKPSSLRHHRLKFEKGDFDGDGKPDLAVVFLADCTPESCADHRKWTVGVLWGGDGWSKVAESPRFAPELVDPADLTGDGHPELIVALKECGAHTCFKDVKAYSAQGDKPFRQIMDTGSDASGYGAAGLPQKIELVPSPDSKAKHPRSTLAISGGMVNSAGAGLFQRRATVVWRWDEATGQMVPGQTKWASSDLRLFRLHDALVEMERGDLEQAKRDLREVITSPKLRELPRQLGNDPTYARAMREQLAQTARFELARIALQQQKVDEYERQMSELAADAPKSPATEATRVLGASWRQSASVPVACQKAAAVFPHKENDGWVLDSVRLGYNAPVKFTADFKNGLCAGLQPPK